MHFNYQEREKKKHKQSIADCNPTMICLHVITTTTTKILIIIIITTTTMPDPDALGLANHATPMVLKFSNYA